MIKKPTDKAITQAVKTLLQYGAWYRKAKGPAIERRLKEIREAKESRGNER